MSDLLKLKHIELFNTSKSIAESKETRKNMKLRRTYENVFIGASHC